MPAKRIAITMGDPGGIGPEIVLKALNSMEVAEICRPVVVGDLGVLDEAKRALPISTHIPLSSVDRPGAETRSPVVRSWKKLSSIGFRRIVMRSTT